MTQSNDKVFINGVKQFRNELTSILEAAQQGKEVEIRTYTHGRVPRSVLTLAKKEDLGNTKGA